MKGIKLLFCRTLSSQSGASITMGSLASFLRNNDYDIKLEFLNRSSLSNSYQIINDSEKYPIMIFKPNFKDYNIFFPLLKKFVEKGIIKRIFLCGPFATLNANDIMRVEKWVNGIIIGDPEETVLELLNSMDKDYNWDKSIIGGYWENIGFTGHRTPVDINKLPFPARDIETREKSAQINMEASRGCVYNCSFCHVPLINRKRVVKNPKKIVDEIEYLFNTYKKSLFIFNDPLFWVSKDDDKRIEEICNEIINRKLNIKFYIYLRCNPFPSVNLLSLMKKAGLVRVFLGIENASKKSLNNYNKGVSLDVSNKSWDILKELGINVHIGYIVFEPYSTTKDISENITHLHKLGKLYRIGTIIEPPRVIPGSLMHKKLINDGLILTELNYEKLTYGFNWKNDNVAKIFKHLRTFFLEKLRKRWYELEYYCVSGELFKSLAIANDDKNIIFINNQYKHFYELLQEINDFLYDLINKLINGLIESNNLDSYVNEFVKLKDKIKVEWSLIISNISKVIGPESYNELYKGEQWLS
jgi:anaerobic magnesium-protoporphyrin IX monomethyl ester cyclase